MSEFMLLANLRMTKPVNYTRLASLVEAIEEFQPTIVKLLKRKSN